LQILKLGPESGHGASGVHCHQAQSMVPAGAHVRNRLNMRHGGVGDLIHVHRIQRRADEDLFGF
jgi:hypothetical protein